jgi:hypothetical protein
MSDTEPQTAGGKVLWHFTMSLDGFVAGPNRVPDMTLLPVREVSADEGSRLSHTHHLHVNLPGRAGSGVTGEWAIGWSPRSRRLAAMLALSDARAP